MRYSGRVFGTTYLKKKTEKFNNVIRNVVHTKDLLFYIILYRVRWKASININHYYYYYYYLMIFLEIEIRLNIALNFH